MKFWRAWGCTGAGRERDGRWSTWEVVGIRPCPPGRFHVSSTGLGTFGDIRGPLACGRKAEMGEEPGGWGRAERNVAVA